MASAAHPLPPLTGSTPPDDLHVCMVYRRNGFAEIAIPFLTDGLREGFRCALVAEPGVQMLAMKALADAGVDVPGHQSSGALVLPQTGDYPAGAAFEPAGMAAFLRSLHDDALAAGFKGFRWIGEMGWTLDAGVRTEHLFTLEALVSDFCSKTQSKVICLYDEERFDPAMLEEMLLAHPVVGIDGRRFPSAYYESLVRPSRLEQRQRLRLTLEQLERLHETEQALRRREREFAVLAEQSPDLIARFDRSLRHVYVNPAVAAATGISAASFIGFTNEELGMPSALVARWREAFERVLETGEPETLTFDFSTPEGPRHFESRVVPEVGADGRVEGVLGVTRDVTERQRLEDRLTLYREIVANSNEAIAIIAPDGTYLEQNEAHRKLLGYSDADLEGQTPAIHLGEATFAEVAAALAHDGQYRAEVVSRSKAGDAYDIDLSAFSVCDDAGRPLCFVGIKRDITERKVLERRREELLRREQAALEASERERGRLLEIFHQAPAAVAVLRGPDHVFELANAAYERASGRTAEQLLGRSVREALPEVEGQGFFELLDEVYRTDEPFVGDEMPVQLERSGPGVPETRYFTFVYQPLRSPDGTVEGIFAHVVDVTDHVRSREAIQTITDNAGSGLLMMDALGDPIFMNPAAEEISGFRFDDIRDRPLHDSVHFLYPDGRHYPRSECPIDQAAAALAPIRDHEDVFVRKDGSFYHVRGNVAPIQRDGQVIGVVLEFRDVTAEKLAQEELRRANAIKDDFLGLVSHEMRTPLTAVLGFAHILGRSGEQMAPERRADTVREIGAAAQRLRDIIENMLLLTRLDRTSLEMQPLEVRPLLEEVVADHRERYPERPLRMEIPGSLPAISGNAVLLRQVMLNLLSNAEKYSPPSRDIVVDARREGSGVAVRVLDHGTGIAPSEAEAIFEVFYRSERVKQQPGIGLGLAVCKRLVETHGGTIWATPLPERGTEIGFLLPAATS